MRVYSANCKLHDAFIDLNVHTHAPRANQTIIRQRKPTDYLQLQLRLQRSYLNLPAIPCVPDLLAHSFFSPFSLLIAFSNANNFRIWYETQCEAIAPRIISALWLFITYGANYSWIPGECRWRFVWMHSHSTIANVNAFVHFSTLKWRQLFNTNKVTRVIDCDIPIAQCLSCSSTQTVLLLTFMFIIGSQSSL